MADVRLPSQININGTVDEHVDFEDFIASLSPGTTVLFPDGADIAIDETVNITQSGLTLWGNGGGFKLRALTNGASSPNPLHRKILKFTNGSDITLYNFTTVGGNPNAGTGDSAYDITKESQHLLEFRGTQGVLIDRWTGSDPHGDFLYLGDNQNPSYTPTRNVTVRRFDLNRNGRMGFGITGAENVDISRGAIQNCRRSVLDIEPNNEFAVLRNIRFHHCDVGPHRLQLFSNVGAGDAIHEDIALEFLSLYGQSGPDFAVARMSMTIQANQGTPGQYRKRYKIRYNWTGNQIGSPGGYAIFVYSVDGLEVIGNTQPMEPGRNMHLVSLERANDVKVRSNTILNATNAIRFGGGGQNTNYCSKYNLISNPLIEESVSYECS